MNNYPFDPKLLANLTKLYHNYIKDAAGIIKSSQSIDFSKVEIENLGAVNCNGISATECESTHLYYENFLLTSAYVGIEN